MCLVPYSHCDVARTPTKEDYLELNENILKKLFENKLVLYYGGADKVIDVATGKLSGKPIGGIPSGDKLI